MKEQTKLQEMIYNVIPPNLLEKNGITELLDVFFKVVDDTCKISSDIPEYVNIDTEVLSEDIMRIYLENIWSIIQSVKGELLQPKLGSVSPTELKNYCYADENLGLTDENTNIFFNNNSVGLLNILPSEEIIVQEYFNGTDTEFNKTFILDNLTGVTHLTTIDDGINNNNIKPSINCCSSIPCVAGNAVACTKDFDINKYIREYTGSNLALDVLNQTPGVLTDCITDSAPEDNATEPKYKLGSNWMYVDFYVDDEFVKNTFNLSSLLDLKSKINREHIWSSKNFKQNKGHAVAFYFAYNIIKEIKLGDSDTYQSLEYMNLEELKKANGELIPFNYIVRSLINEEVYKKIIHPIAHPVGFNGVYKRTLGFDFNDNFCKNIIDDYDAFFIYSISTGKYFDVRDGDGIFGTNGSTGNQLRYNSEIQERYIFEQHEKSYIILILNNGYKYVKDFDESLKLLDNSGVIIKVFDKSTGLVPVKTRILSNIPHEESYYFETVDNNRLEYNTIDPITLLPATKVYRIDFNNDGAEEGGFLSNQHTIVYLDNNVSYHIANNRIKMIDSVYNEYNDFGDYRYMLYNGLEYTDDVLCDEIIYWHMKMNMRDNNCIPHNMIIQEPLPTPITYTDQLSEDLDLDLVQTDEAIDMNSYIETYINNNGSDEGLAEDILDKITHNLYDSSLQGTDLNNNDVIEWIEYSNNSILNKKDWGWIIGADDNGVLYPDADDTDINTYVSNIGTPGYSILDILMWQRTQSSLQRKVSPKIGSFDTCSDKFPIEESFNNLMYHIWTESDTNGEPGNNSFHIDDVFRQSIQSHLTSLLSTTDNIDSWEITEIVQGEYLELTIEGPNTNPQTTPAATNVDLNAFIANYILINGNDDNLGRAILDSSTAPGAVTNSTGELTVTTPVGFILDSADAGGFDVGGNIDISAFRFADNLEFR